MFYLLTYLLTKTDRVREDRGQLPNTDTTNRQKYMAAIDGQKKQTLPLPEAVRLTAEDR